MSTFERPDDQAILAHEQELKDEVLANSSLIGNVVETQVLLSEYSVDTGFYKKVKTLCEIFPTLRKIVRDGNCFFRAWGFRLFELCLTDKAKLVKIKEVATKYKDMMLGLGFPSVRKSPLI
eukprot:Colp12_sorted_trinity150504_noHs@34964